MLHCETCGDHFDETAQEPGCPHGLMPEIANGLVKQDDADFRSDLQQLCATHHIDLLAGVVLQTTSKGMRIGGMIIEALELTDDQQDRLTDKMLYVVKKWLVAEGVIKL